MEVFGVGLPELALIMIVILVIFGPDQLPEIAKKLGHATRDIRRSLNDINSEVNEIRKPFDEVKSLNPFVAADTTTTPPNLIVADDADLPPVAPPEAAPPADPQPNEAVPEDPSTPSTDPDLDEELINPT